MYNPIEEDATWKVTSGTVADGWKTLSFNDGEWASVALSSPSLETSGAQYFRKTFTGLADLAAFEARFKFQYGIIAYMNGNEIFRDNMPAGEASPLTSATGSYITLGYRGVIRNGAEMNGNGVMAVELHFLSDAPVTSVSFNCWVAQYASTNPDQTAYKCYMTYPEGIDGEGDEPAVFDFNTGTYYVGMTSDTPTIRFNYANVRPVVNAVSVISGVMNNFLPSTLTTSGADLTSSPFTAFIWGTGVIYSADTRIMRYSLFNTNYYKNIQTAMLSEGNRVWVPELSYYVCNIVAPTSIVMVPAATEAVVGVTSIEIKPAVGGFSSCTVTPALPQGLTLNAATCAISGVLAGSFTSATFTISTAAGATPITGTFSITAVACNGNVMFFKRTYPARWPERETFTLTNAATGEVIFDEPASSTQTAGLTKIMRFCTPAERVKIAINSESGSWDAQSWLYVGSVTGGNDDTLLRVKCNSYLNLRSEYYVRVGYAIGAQQPWRYLMGSVPENWHSMDVSAWAEASMGSFPDSTNRVQLYRKSFNVASLDNVGGMVLNIRARYALIVYLNGHEAYRIGFTGALSPTTYTEHVYPELKYHSVSLPLRQVASGTQAPVDLIVAGQNTIAIGLLALSDEQKTASFDATLQFLGDEANSRVIDYTLAYSAIPESADPFQNNMRSSMSMSTCTPNSLDITFADSRAEAITSFSVTNYYLRMIALPYGVTVKAQNLGDDDWVTLGTFEGWKWWSAAQEKKIYIANSKAYQRYRFENWNSGSTTECDWNVNRLDVYLDKMNVDIPELHYDSLDGYLNVELAEIFPNSPYYTLFTVQPELPAGLSMDQATGAVMGTPTALTESRQYTISAKKITGETSSSVVTMAVTICKDGKSLITSTLLTTSMPSLEFYRLYAGRGTSGQLLRDEPSLFMANNNLVYADFCLPHGIYTFQRGMSQSDEGLSFPAGHSLSVDLGTLRFEMGHVPQSAPASGATMVFSSLLPFQINYDDWRVYRSATAVPANWNANDFDDAAWDVVKAADIGIVAPVTFYVRRSFEIPSEDYHVLNIHTKFTGGMAAYYNGRLVARFNLPETFHAETFASAPHDFTAYSKFHVILPTSGSVVGKNTMAFEVHREEQQSTADPVVFDATGAFGVADCSPVVDSQIMGQATELSLGDYPNLFDLNPTTLVIMAKDAGTFMEWTVENLEGSKFNSYGFTSGEENFSMAWSLYARGSEEDDYVTLHETPAISLVDRERSAFATPVAIASFRQFRFFLDANANKAPRISEMVFQYCVATGNVCPAIDDYPAVQEGQISPAGCPDKYTGYSYRMCEGGALGEVKLEHCVPKVPTNLRYKETTYNFVLDVEVATPQPEYDNLIDEFYLDESVALPEGLALDATTGVISGKPTKVAEIASYTIYGKNSRSATQVVLSIGVRKGQCYADGVFDTTEVDETAVYECSSGGSFVGTQRRLCLLGKTDGEWQKASGFCLSVALLVVLIVVAILIVVIVILVVLRLTRKKKSVGGVKGAKGKTVKVTKAEAPKQKEVKV